MWLKVKENKPPVNDAELLTVGTLFTCHILKIFCSAGWGKHTAETGWVMAGCIGWLKAGGKRGGMWWGRLSPRSRRKSTFSAHMWSMLSQRSSDNPRLIARAPGTRPDQDASLVASSDNHSLSFLQSSADAASFTRLSQSLFVQVLCPPLLFGIILQYIHISPLPPTFEDPLRGFCILVTLLPLPNDYSSSIKCNWTIAHEQSPGARQS